MKHSILIRGVLALVALVLVSASVHAQVGKFVGKWESLGSSVVYTVDNVGGAPVVTVVDESDGEKLVTSEARMEGKKVLLFHLFTPSTNWNVDIRLTMVSKDKLSEVVSGDGSGEYFYLRSNSKALKKAQAELERNMR